MKEQVIPNKGDVISITWVSDGEGRLTQCKAELDKITAVYLDGTVAVRGDVYFVEPASGGKARWQTARPRKERD